MSTTTRTHHSSHELSITGLSHTQEESYIHLFQKIFCQAPWFESWAEYDVKRNLRKVMSRQSFLGFTALLNNTPVGFLTGYCLFDRVKLTGPFYIDQLFVDDRYQNMGIGRALMDEFMKQLQERTCPIILLLTREDSPTEDFYMKYGFKKFHTVFRMRGKALFYYTQKIHREESPHA